MKKIISLFFCVLFVLSSLMAARFHSVPLDSSVYRIIDSAEARGLIKPQMEVRPYNLNKVLDLLEEISLSPGVS